MSRTLEQRKKSRCNEHCIEKTVQTTGESKALVEHVIDFLHNFIAGKMAEGSFEAVRIQTFGTFKPKLKKVQWINHQKTLPPMYKKLLYAASQKSKKPKSTNETTDNQPGLPGD